MHTRAGLELGITQVKQNTIVMNIDTCEYLGRVQVKQTLTGITRLLVTVTYVTFTFNNKASSNTDPHTTLFYAIIQEQKYFYFYIMLM
jgi:hypothetical protein